MQFTLPTNNLNVFGKSPTSISIGFLNAMAKYHTVNERTECLHWSANDQVKQRGLNARRFQSFQMIFWLGGKCSPWKMSRLFQYLTTAATSAETVLSSDDFWTWIMTIWIIAIIWNYLRVSYNSPTIKLYRFKRFELRPKGAWHLDRDLKGVRGRCYFQHWWSLAMGGWEREGGGWFRLQWSLFNFTFQTSENSLNFCTANEADSHPNTSDPLPACPQSRFKKKNLNTSVELVESSEVTCAFYSLHTPILSPHNWDASVFPSREISGDAYRPLYFHVRSLFFHLIGFSSHSMSHWQPGNGEWRLQIKTKGK